MLKDWFQKIKQSIKDKTTSNKSKNSKRNYKNTKKKRTKKESIVDPELKNKNRELLKEKAPPNMEEVVLSLKKQYGEDSSIPYKIAWSIYNRSKKHNKK